jgi:hypothetical protein
VFYSPVLQCEGQLGFALETMQFKDKCLYEAFVSLTSFNDPIDSDGDDDLNICESKSKKSTLIWSIANTRDVIGPWDDDKVYFLLDDKCLYLYKK